MSDWRFQPLGYRFEVNSLMNVDALVAAIRKRKKGWFAVENGARGWIIGPFLCLWFSALDRHGPMVLARIKTDNSGTKVVGRAGADLNGTLLFLLVTPFIAWAMLKLFQLGQGSFGDFAFFFVVFGLGLPLTLWINSKDRRDADPLVNFLRLTVQPTNNTKLKSARSFRAVSRASLSFNGAKRKGPVSDSDLEEALLQLGTGDFIILGFAPEKYIQVMVESDKFRIEKRDGSAKHHYEVDLPKGDINAGDQYDASHQRLLDRMTDYLYGRKPVHELNWRRVSV